jgi:hypothetical protein
VGFSSISESLENTKLCEELSIINNEKQWKRQTEKELHINCCEPFILKKRVDES